RTRPSCPLRPRGRIQGPHPMRETVAPPTRGLERPRQTRQCPRPACVPKAFVARSLRWKHRARPSRTNHERSHQWLNSRPFRRVIIGVDRARTLTQPAMSRSKRCLAVTTRPSPGALRRMESHGPGQSLELNRPDLAERNVWKIDGVDDRLADEDLAL